MSQVFAQQNTLIAIPPSWEPPKYHLGQVVNARLYEDDRYVRESVTVVGFAYRSLCTHPEAVKVGMGWEYTLMLSPTSPNWFVEDELIIASEEDIFLPSTDALQMVIEPSLSVCSR
jgi:hypothetical protein